jgi:hypothetical protein
VKPSGTPWSSPLVVAILAATAAGVGNLAVAYLNGKFERDLAEQRADAERILEAIKTGEPERAAKNLQFLVETGLISDPTRVAKMRTYLASRDPEAVATLPPQSSQFTFEKSQYLDQGKQRFLSGRLESYSDHLNAIGFPDVNIRVLVEKMDAPNAYYDPSDKTVHVDHLFSDDLSVFFREYNHGVLLSNRENYIWASECQVVESALADYFAASYLDDPRIGAKSAKASNSALDYFRTLENAKTMAELKSQNSHSADDPSQVWGMIEVLGGAAWDLRKKFGKESADRLIARAWTKTECDQNKRMLDSFTRNVAGLIAEEMGADAATQANELLKRRGFSG